MSALSHQFLHPLVLPFQLRSIFAKVRQGDDRTPTWLLSPRISLMASHKRFKREVFGTSDLVFVPGLDRAHRITEEERHPTKKIESHLHETRGKSFQSGLERLAKSADLQWVTLRLRVTTDPRKMPCLNLSTNVSLEGIDTSSVLSDATKTVASLIGKPEAYVMIVLKGSVPMSFGGTEQPAAYGELVSIGGLNPDVNKKLSAAIATILETKLSVPKSRFFLKFYDTKPSNFGWNGSTF
ncbi:hypothetical protein L1049_011855 [Liquidambar formosana]|uniref:Uncharacterized protein n=1 Tax=Liquidambar formosana TaxID=63359 RepID=A0AAP0RS69_LIQFO